MLTLKQQRFVEEYCLDHNASRAARAAGYAEKSAHVAGSRMLMIDKVIDAVRSREMEAETSLGITREKVLKALCSAFEDAKERREPAAMIAACRAVAAMCGYNRPERQSVEVSVNVGVDLKRLETMSDDDLMRIVQS